MDWRLQFSDRQIVAVDILPGDPYLAAVWYSPQMVYFFDLATGAAYDPLQITFPALTDYDGPAWRTLAAHLRGPNMAYLPVINRDRAQGPAVFTSRDGDVNLYHTPDDRLMLVVDNYSLELNRTDLESTRLCSVALDREWGTVAALDDHGRYHLYQQHIYVGTYAVENSQPGKARWVMLPDAAAGGVLVSDGELQAFDMSGRIVACSVLVDPVGCVACSPDGQLILVSDQLGERLTVFDGDLKPVRQALVFDILESAVPLQLFGDVTLPFDATLRLAVANDGSVVLGVGGMVCACNVERFSALPRPRLLL